MPQTGTMGMLSGRSGRTSPQDRIYLSTMLDAYGELLAPRQRECCDLYFNEDLSLTEIAETCGISRQGAWDNIRRGSEALEEMEMKTGLLRRQTEISEGLRHLAESLRKLETMCAEESALRERIHGAAEEARALLKTED